jgi:hypothetical protein
MAQGVLPFKYEAEKNRSGMTALAGLPTYLELASVCGLQASIERHVGVRRGTQGWSDAQVLMSLILLNLAGGDCMDDLSMLQGDPGFAELMHRTETHGMPRRERRMLLRRFRKERTTATPSPSSVFRYLSAFHDPHGAADREPHKAFIPAAGEHLRGLARVNADLVAFVQKHSPHKHATLDQDATLVETHKADAFFSYKHFRAYQPLNTYWAEHDLMLHSEFRDGNVPAGFEQLRVLKDALALLPDDVETVSLRSDSAGYQTELLKYCAEGKNARFGVIEFTVSADVNAEFRRAALALDVSWKPLCDGDGRPNEHEQEYAEVAFVPSWISNGRKDAPEYRFLAIREPLRQLDLPHIAAPTLPFPAQEFGNAGRFALFGVVTNRLTMPGDALIRWHRERCGMSEKAHAVMKDDLAGGKMPSALFGVNAAWWTIMIIAMNLNTTMKRLVLGPQWATRRMKAVRVHLIALPGQVMMHARQLIVRLGADHPSNELLLRVRQGILALVPVPSG